MSEGSADGLRLLEIAVSAGRHGIIVTDPNRPDNPIVYANPAFERLTGYSSEEILGRNCRFLQGDDRAQTALEEVRSALREGRECRVILRNYKKDGTPFYNELSISPVRDEDGGTLFFVGVQEDVTERKRTEDALREAEERYHSIFENSVGGIFRSSVDGRILAANPAMARILGYEGPEEMAREVTDAGEQLYEDPERRRELVRLLAEHGAVSDFEVRVRRKDGEVVWISTSARALFEDGRLVGFQGTVEDISERKRVEEALREETETLQKLNRVGQMLSSELDEGRLAEALTDEATRLTGASFGAFLNAAGDETPPYALRAVSGLPRAAFLSGPHRARAARVLELALRSREVVRSGDTREGADHAPPPDGDASEDQMSVASYVAVPVVSRSEEVLGGLVFGHPEPEGFGGREEGIATALAAQAAVAMDNARLFESVRESEERHRVLYEDNPSMYFTLDEEGKILSVNRFGAEHLGYEPSELVGRPVLEIFHEDDGPVISRNLDACLGHPGSLRVWEARKARKDGDVLWVEERANAVRGAGGEPVVLVVSEDITERKRAEEALREVREAERARIARDIHDEALQDIVHALQQIEIGKALSGGSGAVDLDEVSAALKRSVEGLRGAIFDLRLEGHRERSFPGMLASLVKMSRRRSPGLEIELSIERADELPLGRDEQVELLRILQEALTNARRHSGARKVSVSVGTSSGGLLAEVSDDGRGFDAEGASGMGTRNMHERARALGGDLRVESRPGEGTAVRFEMPLGPEGSEEDVARILLVEDHASFRQAIASMLDREPELSVVGQAGSLEEARQALESTEVDVAIVDLGLPDGYGGELVKELRDRNPGAQALVLSASLDRSEIARAVEFGAAGILHKSVGMAEVGEAVRKLRAGETLLPLPEVVDLLRFAGVRRREEHEARYALSQLTPREREVLQALAEGLDGREIAERLRISVTTERNHMARILAKLGVHSRLQALVFALRHGAVEIKD